MKKELGIFILLVACCAFLGFRHPQFFGAENLQNQARLIGMYGIFSIGLGLIIITGGIDLSVGSIFALQGVLLSMMLRDAHWPWQLAVLAIVGGTMLLGWLHGVLIARVQLQPFVVTLCGLLIYRGLARYIADDSTKGFGSQSFGMLRELASGNVLSIPMPFVLLIGIAVIMWVVLHRSVYGRYLYAVGRNDAAARYSGINDRRIISSAYVVSAGLAGIAGILLAFYTNSVSPSTHGNFYELYGIAAAVLGGCSLRGGEGSILGIIIGTALLQVLQNLVNLEGIPSSLNFAVMGAVIMVGVLVDQLFLQRRSAKIAPPADAPRPKSNETVGAK